MDAHPAVRQSEALAVIITGGDPVPAGVFAALPADPAHVIAADSGLDHAIDAGLMPGVLIGDLDSVSPEAAAALQAAGGETIAHPVDKDDTDLALAIRLAISRGATRIVVLGGAGDRLSHVLGNCAAVAHAVRRGVPTTWHTDSTVVHVAAPDLPAHVDGAAGDLVSLLPFGGDALGVETAGLRWSLTGETLVADETRGVSNEMEAPAAHIAIAAGLLFVVHERNP